MTHPSHAAPPQPGCFVLHAVLCFLPFLMSFFFGGGASGEGWARKAAPSRASWPAQELAERQRPQGFRWVHGVNAMANPLHNSSSPKMLSGSVAMPLLPCTGSPRPRSCPLRHHQGREAQGLHVKAFLPIGGKIGVHRGQCLPSFVPFR